MSSHNQGSIFEIRHSRLFESMEKAGLEALVINPGPTLTYLTGLHFHLSERPVVVIFTPHHVPVIVVPALEAAKVEALSFSMQASRYSDDPSTWSEAFRQAAALTHLEGRKVGVETRRLRVLELRYLENQAPGAQFVSADPVLTDLRMHKDQNEVEAMRRAVQIAQQALLAAIPSIRPGASERELAAELTLQILRAGSDSEMPFFPIVASGPNSANPHATPTDRRLSEGDLLVIDWGAAHQGYISDLTRTFAIGNVEPEFERIAQVVEEANAAGRRASRPGIPAGEVDRAARAVIESAGYGQYFIHRTGHGIGMEGHEEPYMYGENTLTLAPGMAFTVEPGIYLPGRGGVRIEDDMVLTETGGESLSDLPRELFFIR